MSKLIRRPALARTLLLGVALVAGLQLLGNAAPLNATSSAAAFASENDAWLRKLKGPHRQLFDAPSPAGGIPVVHVMNYYNAWNKEYGVPDKDVNAILTFYGTTTFHGLSDAMWSKYRLGEFLGEKDAGGTPFTANPWRTAPVIVGMTIPQASIESLQARGATFIICNNALTIFSGLVAKARGLDAATVYADMKANILPNVTVVPAMVVAIEQAQRAGLTYHRQ